MTVSWGPDGVAVGSTTMFDRDGPIGAVTVSTLAQDRPVDPAEVQYD